MICGKSNLVPEIWDVFKDDWEKVKDQYKQRFEWKLKKKERKRKKARDNGKPAK